MISQNISFELVEENCHYMLRKTCVVCGAIELDFMGEFTEKLDKYEELELATSNNAQVKIIEFIEIHEACINPNKVN